MKKIWIILISSALAGILFMITGLALGASTDLYIDKSGIHFGDSNDYYKTVADDLNDIKNINIKTASANIKIKKSNKIKLEINCRKSNPVFFDSCNGTLKIKQD